MTVWASSAHGMGTKKITVRETGYPPPPLHSPGDCNVVGVFLQFLLRICCFTWKKHFQWICDSSLSCSWQKGDRPDNELSLSHAASRQKKSGPLALCPFCLWRQNINHYMGRGTDICPWVGQHSVPTQAAKQNLVISFIFVRTTPWPQWNGMSFFQDTLWAFLL